MKTYVWITFAFMGWGYYELSGGAEFVPEQSIVAEVEPAADPVDVAPEVVARADTTPLLTVTPAVEAEPQAVIVQAAAAVAPAAPSAPSSAGVTAVVAPAPAPEAAPEPDPEPIVSLVAAPAPDLRQVAGSRVNMRMGPGTSFDVITTLDGGTTLEVLEVNADGWANVRSVEQGYEGWMAERLLTTN